MRGNRGNWYVTSPKADWPRVAICPIVRVHEIYVAGTPQFGRFAWFLSCAALDCVGFADAELKDRLQLLVHDGDYLKHLQITLRELGPDDRRTLRPIERP